MGKFAFKNPIIKLCWNEQVAYHIMKSFVQVYILLTYTCQDYIGLI
jgi:hypothetical protein